MFRSTFSPIFFALFLAVCFNSAANPTVVQWYNEDLEKEYGRLHHNFLRTAGITQTVWQQALTDCQQEFNHLVQVQKRLANPNLEPHLRATALELLTICGLNPNSVELVKTTPQQTAWSAGHLIGLSQQGFEQLGLTKAEQYAVILHEIAHLIHQDFLEHVCCYFILDRMYEAGTLIKGSEQCQYIWGTINALDRFRERRADIVAGLVAPEYAQGLADYLKKFLNFYGSSIDDGIHPSCEERIEYLTKLFQDLQQEPSLLAHAWHKINNLF